MCAVRGTARIAPLTVVAALAGGCGAERLETPDVSQPFATGGQVEKVFEQAGIRFEAPSDWRFDPGAAPLVASTSSGSVTIGVWRYPRAEPLPEDDAALAAAEEALADAARTREPSFELQRSRRIEVDGAEAIELIGTQKTDGRERRVRSTHVYAKGAEYVVDASASPRDFPAANRNVFRPLVDSMKIDPPRA